MINLNRSLKLITGALFSPDETWRGYRPEAENWQKTAILITGPVIIVTAVLGYILGLLGDDSMLGAMRPTLLNTVFGIVFGIIWAGIAAFIFSTLAGTFGGKASFAAGLAATSLAFVPGYFGQALGRLPWIGWLLGLGLFIYALVLLWRILPMYLDVPDSRRKGHYIISLIACIVVALVLGLLLRPIIGPVDAGLGDRPDFSSSGGAAGGTAGLFGGALRQGELIAAAKEDRYTPPSDGKLDEDQVKDINDTVAHNYALYQEYEVDLKHYVAR